MDKASIQQRGDRGVSAKRDAAIRLARYRALDPRVESIHMAQRRYYWVHLRGVTDPILVNDETMRQPRTAPWGGPNRTLIEGDTKWEVDSER